MTVLPRKPKRGPERCPSCRSDNLIVVRDSSWPSLVCGDCGKFIRDFGD